MSTPGDMRDRGMLQELRTLAKSLQNLQTRRLHQDHQFATKIATEYQQILDSHSNRVSELKVEHSIRRGEETVRIWQEYSIPFVRAENEARQKRDQALAELKKVEQKEKVALEADLQRLTGEAEGRKHNYIQLLQKKRETEDKKAAEMISKLSGGVHYPKNLLGQILVVDKLITAQFSLPKAGPSKSSDAELAENGHGNGIGFEAPSLELYGMDPGNAVPKFGLLTPGNTPPSSNEPRFGALELPATPTPVSRKPGQSSGLMACMKLPPTFKFGPILQPTTSKSPVIPPATKPRTPFTVPASVSGSASKVNPKVVIDLTSDTEDELPPTKRRQIRNSISSPAKSAKSSHASSVKIPITKKSSKKQVSQKVRNPIPPKTPKVIANVIETYDEHSPEADVHTIEKAAKQIEKAVELAPVRDTTPDIFDSDSEYSVTGSRKRRNKHISSETPRVRSGATIMGDLIDRPGAKLSSKGLAFWRWARLMYVPTKLIRFSVTFFWSHKDNGEVSIFNDRASPVGMYLHRMKHTYVPVIGHARKEDVHPEFVIEEKDIRCMQYSSEDSLVCVTKNGDEIYPDVMIKFVGRDDLWGFLVASKEEMGVTIQEK
ncbi:hypothetical protein DL98DRAFT_523634 [Cadophora sp. DSE1049]|nr:hypothetical protein DL98DRAFT_523634 [Cadophora sp. DSE1049]